MLAIVYCLIKLESYLRGLKEIILRTEHNALTFLKTSNARLRRWNLGIQVFNLKPEHIAERKNAVADFLSRLHYEEIKEKEEEVMTANVYYIKLSPHLLRQLKNLHREQKADKYLDLLRTRVEKKEKIAIKCYTIINDLLCRGNLNGEMRVMIPEILLD